MFSNVYGEVISMYNNFENSYSTIGKIEYFSNKNPLSSEKVTAGKIAKVVIILYLSLIGLISLIFVHKENLFPIVSNKPLGIFIAIYLGVIVYIILLIHYLSQKIKYISSLILSRSSIQIRYSHKYYETKDNLESDEFALNKTELQIKRSKRNNVDQNTSRRTPFFIFLRKDNKVNRYKLFATNKCELLAFVLFLESHYGSKNINNLLPAEIESMYYSSNFKLNMKYIF